MSMCLNRCVCIFVALIALGCASSAPRGPKDGGNEYFPGRAEIATLTSGALSNSLSESRRVVVDEWRLEAPLSDVISYRPREAEGLLERMVVESAQERKAATPRITEGASCYARQLGRFYLEHEAYPHRGLQTFMSSRCGMATSRTLASAWDVTPDEERAERGEEADAERLKKVLPATIRAQVQAGGAYELGVWSGEQDGKRIVMAVVMRRQLDLEPLNARADEQGYVTLRGRALQKRWESVSAGFTVSDMGFGACTLDPEVRAPEFALRCQLNRGDREARLDMWGTREGRVLSYGISDLVLWPQIQPDDTYRAPTTRALLREAKIDAAAPLLDQVTALVNHVRAAGGLPAFLPAKKQSEALGKIAPHFFEAPSTILGERLQDRLTMAALAGWDVEAPVLDALFLTGEAPRRDLTQWLSAMLETSAGRRTLLSPLGGQLALGVYAAGDAYAIMAARYTTAPDEPYATRLARISRIINRKRADAGLPGLVWDRRPEAHADDIAAFERGERGEDGHSSIISDFVSRTRARMRGELLETWVTTLSEDGALPPFLLQRSWRKMDALVLLFPRNGGYPWQRYGVFVLLDR